MVWKIFRDGIRSGRIHRLNNVVKRGFCKTEWTKPQFVNKPYSERRQAELPSVIQSSQDLNKVRYGELWKAWYTIEYELFTALSKHSNFFTSLTLNAKNAGPIANRKLDVNDEVFKQRQVDSILQSYSELRAFTSPVVKKSGFAFLEERSDDNLKTATLNANTKNTDEEEKLAQKIETINETPLVEAGPDIVKPPTVLGPAVMNAEVYCEESAKHSDFQIADDHSGNEPDVVHWKRLSENNDRNIEGITQIDETPNPINNYFEKPICNKPNYSGILSLHAVPEVDLDEDKPLSELLERVRQRNRLLRCRDIDHQLKCATEEKQDSMHYDRSRFAHPHQPMQPSWGWPAQPQPQYHPSYPSGQPVYHPPMAPQFAQPMPRKAEPITPDTRPHRATKVNPVTLALYLGPLVSTFRNAGVVFPLLISSLVSESSREESEMELNLQSVYD